MLSSACINKRSITHTLDCIISVSQKRVFNVRAKFEYETRAFTISYAVTSLDKQN